MPRSIRHASAAFSALVLLSAGSVRAQWRNIGPNRGGRSQAVAGSEQRPLEYYFGATGGGLWKTEDGGLTWTVITDGQIGSSSIGAVAVAPSNPDVVYLGTGETELRASILQGDGVYKSVDGGKTWQHLGLADTQAISRIRVSPRNSDVVFVAALGHPFGPNHERGIFRSRDGGKTWKQVLFRGDLAGAVDLCLDPRNPEVVYASIWEVFRTPWLLSSGGPQSGLFKSTDGGDTWADISRRPGLPKSILGKVGVAVSATDSARVYALVEAEDGGLFRSDDAGGTWTLANGDRTIRQRAFYFSRIYADPQDRDTVYVLNVDAYKSIDGGATLERMNTVHADHHDLWIAPENPMRMAEANDGGGTISVNGGRTWTKENFPTAQFYHVATTRDVPYQVCGAQQDYDTVCVPSTAPYGSRVTEHPQQEQLFPVGDGEAGYVATSRFNTGVFYSGNQAGVISRFERSSGEVRDVTVFPLFFSGMPAQSLRDRWQWVFPIVVSPFDGKTIYTASQHLWKSTDEGQSWKRISPDLTRADPKTLGASGGPITKDQNGPEIYGTIFSIGLSRNDEKTVWTGSDDGVVSITRDAGNTWRQITPGDLPEYSRISAIETSVHHPGTAYLAARRYELDDFAPYVFKTADYGRTWKKIVHGIASNDFINVVREDTAKPGLLFAGSAHRVYVSFDDGANWKPFSSGLPDVPVVDIAVEENDLVIATHGRSFWMWDDVSPLREEDSANGRPAVHLFVPRTALRQIRPAVINFALPPDHLEAKLSILDPRGGVVRVITCGPKKSDRDNETVVCRPGTNRVIWDLRYPGPTTFPGMILRSADPSVGPWAPPGTYQVRLEVDGSAYTRPLVVKRDPRISSVTDDDLRKQFQLAMQIRDSTSLANQTVIRIRELKSQLQRLISVTKESTTRDKALDLQKDLSQVEESLYQVRNHSPRDTLNFPIKLNNQLGFLERLVEVGDYPPTAQHYQVYKELHAELLGLVASFRSTVNGKLGDLNHVLASQGLPPIQAGDSMR